MDDLTNRVKRLKAGKTLFVPSESERQNVLRIAQVLGWTIATRKRKKPKEGFTCTRMPV
jgi:hypothetical protein